MKFTNIDEAYISWEKQGDAILDRALRQLTSDQIKGVDQLREIGFSVPEILFILFGENKSLVLLADVWNLHESSNISGNQKMAQNEAIIYLARIFLGRRCDGERISLSDREKSMLARALERGIESGIVNSNFAPNSRCKTLHQHAKMMIQQTLTRKKSLNGGVVRKVRNPGIKELKGKVKKLSRELEQLDKLLASDKLNSVGENLVLKRKTEVRKELRKLKSEMR